MASTLIARPKSSVQGELGLSRIPLLPVDTWSSEATNAINDIMDDKTAAATQRWQRLMIQALP